MIRLINGDALIELINGGYDLDFDEVPETKRELLRMIMEQPTVEAIPISFIEKRIEENKEEINRLREDAEFQKTQFTILWDNELKKNVVVEGRLSATAQTKISEDNSKIEELRRENKDLGDKLMEYSESGVSMTNEGTKEKSKTLTDLLGSTFRVSGNLIQLIILLIPSFFLDTINLLATMAYIDSFEKEKEEE